MVTASLKGMYAAGVRPRSLTAASYVVTKEMASGRLSIAYADYPACYQGVCSKVPLQESLLKAPSEYGLQCMAVSACKLS